MKSFYDQWERERERQRAAANEIPWNDHDFKKWVNFKDQTLLKSYKAYTWDDPEFQQWVTGGTPTSKKTLLKEWKTYKANKLREHCRFLETVNPGLRYDYCPELLTHWCTNQWEADEMIRRNQQRLLEQVNANDEIYEWHICPTTGRFIKTARPLANTDTEPTRRQGHE